VPGPSFVDLLLREYGEGYGKLLRGKRYTLEEALDSELRTNPWRFPDIDTSWIPFANMAKRFLTCPSSH
jgi:hypothetical protein